MPNANTSRAARWGTTDLQRWQVGPGGSAANKAEVMGREYRDCDGRAVAAAHSNEQSSYSATSLTMPSMPGNAKGPRAMPCDSDLTSGPDLLVVLCCGPAAHGEQPGHSLLATAIYGQALNGRSRIPIVRPRA